MKDVEPSPQRFTRRRFFQWPMTNEQLLHSLIVGTGLVSVLFGPKMLNSLDNININIEFGASNIEKRNTSQQELIDTFRTIYEDLGSSQQGNTRVFHTNTISIALNIDETNLWVLRFVTKTNDNYSLRDYLIYQGETKLEVLTANPDAGAIPFSTASNNIISDEENQNVRSELESAYTMFKQNNEN